ncbi:heavy metal transporter [Clostridium sp. chh4-2]|uniref:cation transporter n=1 Tax=Clostridium sp. chh4-2 TaxID=2067550 RepID=UPI000CCFC3E6|nr:cation transporter [Clostridium sp. chh4-2]PNV61051.1 heavy metal transporter [Clostridium sp. chh4-2]
MKKIIKLEGLCCANCAAKIEEGVKKLNGVKSASLSFMTQRLVIEAEDGEEDRIVEAARVLADKIEPEAEFKVIR